MGNLITTSGIYLYNKPSPRQIPSYIPIPMNEKELYEYVKKQDKQELFKDIDKLFNDFDNIVKDCKKMRNVACEFSTNDLTSDCEKLKGTQKVNCLRLREIIILLSCDEPLKN